MSRLFKNREQFLVWLGALAERFGPREEGNLAMHLARARGGCEELEEALLEEALEEELLELEPDDDDD